MNAGVPIYALTSQTATRYRCALFRDVFPLMVKYVGHDREELLREAEKVLVQHTASWRSCLSGPTSTGRRIPASPAIAALCSDSA